MVISEGRRRNPDQRVLRWLAFQSSLRDWLKETRTLFHTRTVPIDVDVAIRWGQLSMPLKRRDIDLFLAASALENDFVIVTRNVRHFEPTGARVLNPYE